ncbi:hypothetical protein ACFSYD_08590 [Paracoccus aerius]
MTITADQIALFVGTLSLAILSPGPGVIAVSQSAFALGRRRALPYGWGWLSARRSGASSRCWD